MVTTNIHEAKTHLSRLVERAAAGETVIIAKAGKPVAKLVAIEPPDTVLMFSAASIWETAIKRGLGRADFTAEPTILHRALLEHGYTEVPVTAALAGLHKDPFDRLLLAQALHEGAMLLTADRALAAYGGPVRLI